MSFRVYKAVQIAIMLALSLLVLWGWQSWREKNDVEELYGRADIA